MSKKFAFAFALLISGSALAGGYRFGDRVTAVMETDKGLFFKSAISCPVNRCQVPPTWAEEKRRRAAALLLTAKVTGMPVYFWWNEYTGPDDNSKTPLPADAIAGEIGLE